MTFGPRTHSSPSPPGGASTPVAGSTSRTASPGSGSPQEPYGRPPVGQFMVTIVEVSVMP